MMYHLFISCPKGLEYLLEEEVKSLGLHVTQVNPRGVYGDASLATIYNLCLWSRLANRLQLILFNGQAYNEQTIYKLCQEFAWQTIFSADKTIAVQFHGTTGQIRNTMYGAQVVKDAIVDHFMKLQHKRPVVDKKTPEVLIHAFLKGDELTVSFDLTGYSLHQRGYRTQAGRAPVKENVACAMLLRAQWPKLADAGYDFYDPFCGSGTLVIEAAMMAAQIAPGLIRNDQSLTHWAQHQPSQWEKARQKALHAVKPVKLKLYGSDINQQVIQIAKDNASRAGVSKLVDFECLSVRDIKPKSEHGLIVCNPPYGERLGEMTELLPLYQQMGEVFAEHFQGWKACYLTSDFMLSKATGLRAAKQYTIFNGAIECKLYCLMLENNQFRQPALSESAKMFKNRLQKNFNHLKKWARKNDVHAFRVYDADLPEYAFAIDYYDGHAVLQEYKAPSSVPAHKAQQRSLDVLKVTPDVLDIPAANMIVKQRSKQKGSSQYQKLAQKSKVLTIPEGQVKVEVNLTDYLDTGLFLDHRPLRLSFEKLNQQTRFLNLFCYTAVASLHAAKAGAKTTNVDMSKTYLAWAEKNFKLNQISLNQHEFVQADCLKWLEKNKGQFDVIFLDPPSFSNSKRMADTLDIQRDHLKLINLAMKQLKQDGKLYFSTNLKRFKLSPEVEGRYEVKDITSETIGEDFNLKKPIHHCYLIIHSQDRKG